MPSITPSPPYMPPHPALLFNSKHYQGSANNRHIHPHHSTATVVHANHTSSFHRVIPSSSNGIAGLHQHVGPQTPHSTLQSSSSNQSSTQGTSHVRPPGHANGGLNMSSLSSKQSVGGNSGSVSPGTTGQSVEETAAQLVQALQVSRWRKQRLSQSRHYKSIGGGNSSSVSPETTGQSVEETAAQSVQALQVSRWRKPRLSQSKHYRSVLECNNKHYPPTLQ